MSQDLQTRKCFTIGYGNEPAGRFIASLHRNGIDTVVDVRTTPYSKFRPDFNRENLSKILASGNISYRYLGDTLGGRYTNPALLLPDGSVDYRKVRETGRFRDGIVQLIAIISSGKTVALLCAEKEPERCHRSLLVAPGLVEKGVEVIHIREGKSV